MTHASVFSGIGGPEVAASMLGWENLFHCEINEFGRKVLDYWYPNSKSYEDITKTDFRPWCGQVDVLTGGFPCQPFSYAGRRRGAEDDRYLWPSMYRTIDEIQPTWVVAENVAGILTMVEQGEVSKVAGTANLFDAFDDLRGRFELRETFTLQRICSDLESHGYAVQPVLVPACAVGAPHRRDRVFIVARRVTADPVSRGKGTPRPSGCVEGSRGDTHQQPSERRAAAERIDRLHAVLRHATDTSCERGERLRPRQSEVGRAQQEQSGGRSGEGGSGRFASHTDSNRGCEVDEHMESKLADGPKPVSNGGQRNVADSERLDDAQQRASSANTKSDGGCGESRSKSGKMSGQDNGKMGESQFNGGVWWFRGSEAGRREEADHCGERWYNFPSVSPVHRGNDGLPFDVDCLTLSFGKWRTEALKAYGNAIVPQVMYEIFRAIEITESNERF